MTNADMRERAKQLAVSRKQQRKKDRELSRERRRHLIEVSVALMRPCETPFNAEGPLRSGYRSGLCLEGWRWQDADAEAEHIVLTALRWIGAKRPLWAEGQPSWAQPGFDPVYHTHCLRCGDNIPDERGGNQARGVVKYCSDLCAQAEYTWRVRYYGEGVTMAEHLARCAARRQRVFEVEIGCPHCGKSFKPGYKVMRRRFCSVACADAGKPRRVSRMDEIACVQCGVGFRPKGNTGRKFCSPACYHASQAIDVRGVERQCVVCSAVFRVLSAADPQRTCSRRCGYLWRDRAAPARPAPAEADEEEGTSDGTASAHRRVA